MASGDLYPTALDGHYIFADYASGAIFAVDPDDRRDITFLFDDGLMYRFVSSKAPTATSTMPIWRADISDGSKSWARITPVPANRRSAT